MIFFTSDTHFGHKNIIKYCNRPYKCIEEMDDDLIKKWNEKIHPNDFIYHLGDFAFADINQYIDRLNGKIILIRGNHDHHRSIKTAKFHEVYDLYTLKKTTPNLILCHYAMRVWERSHYDTWHLYGHTHNFMPSFQNSFDAGVDCHGYSPISFDDVEKIIKDQRHKIGE